VAASSPTRPRRSVTRSERTLLRAAGHGSPDALEELARTQWPNAYRVALGITGDSAAAEDVAQEGLLSAVSALDRFDRRRPSGRGFTQSSPTGRSTGYGRVSAARKSAFTMGAGWRIPSAWLTRRSLE
jgi:hypothetical protein